MVNLKLARPLAVFDIEATGLNARIDRIVELCVIKIVPDGSRGTHTYRVNPGIPIPPEAMAIHGISDADVAASPSFEQIAKPVFNLLDDCDLCGYNIVNFDVPLLVEEFMRAKMVFRLDGRRLIDAQRIFHKKEPRDLTAAVGFYCGEVLVGAHGAEADTAATVKVLEGQLERYPDLPRDVGGLDLFCNPRDPTWVDRAGRLKWENGEIVINFGKKRGVPLRTLAQNETSFLKWILRGDFPRDTQEVVRNALDGQYPDPPPRAVQAG